MSEAPAYKKQKLDSAPSTEALAASTASILSQTTSSRDDQIERGQLKSLSALYTSIKASARVALDLESTKGETSNLRDMELSPPLPTAVTLTHSRAGATKDILVGDTQTRHEAQNKSAVLTDLLVRLQASSDDLQAALDLHSLPAVPTFCAREPTAKAAKQLASLAHKLSYTTFAPTRILGPNLFRPPAPQDFDFRASILHKLPRRQNAASQSAGIAHGMQQSKSSSPVLEPEELAPSAPVEATAEATDATLGAKPAAKASIVGPMRAALDFILNPDLEEAEEFSSSEDESD